jgi:hypothetical protein
VYLCLNYVIFGVVAVLFDSASYVFFRVRCDCHDAHGLAELSANDGHLGLRRRLPTPGPQIP